MPSVGSVTVGCVCSCLIVMLLIESEVSKPLSKTIPEDRLPSGKEGRFLYKAPFLKIATFRASSLSGPRPLGRVGGMVLCAVFLGV